MSGVAARQVVVVGISNADELVTQAGTNAVQDAMDALRDLCVLQGVDAEHIRRHGPSTLLVRVDDLSCDKYLDLLRNISAGAGELFAPNVSVPAPCVRVGAINERASRSLVNDAADTLLAYMSHYDSPIVFLAGDDASAWRGRDTTGIDLISNTRLKHIDPFTGLLCEKRFFELLGLALRDHELYGNTLSVLYLDIDDFKSYNRAFGYDEGNKLIQYMARQLREVFASDVVGYLSVDHFAVLSSAPDILRKCAAIHASVKSYSETFASLRRSSPWSRRTRPWTTPSLPAVA